MVQDVYAAQYDTSRDCFVFCKVVKKRCPLENSRSSVPFGGFGVNV